MPEIQSYEVLQNNGIQCALLGKIVSGRYNLYLLSVVDSSNRGEKVILQCSDTTTYEPNAHTCLQPGTSIVAMGEWIKGKTNILKVHEIEEDR